MGADVKVVPVEQAMRLLTRVNVAQYLLANTRTRSNGASKALHHEALCKAYVSVFRNIDPDRVRRVRQRDYDAVHDATADELTNLLDTAIGFDLDAYVDDGVAERFFSAFHRIACRVLACIAPTDEDPTTPEAQAAARLSLRDTFIAEKGLWSEFAETVLHQQSSSSEDGHNCAGVGWSGWSRCMFWPLRCGRSFRTASSVPSCSDGVDA